MGRASSRRRRAIALLATMITVLAGTNAQAGGGTGTTSFGGARVGASGLGLGGIGRAPGATSIIRHGDTGFSIYSQQGVTRVIGTPGVSRTVRMPDGSTTRVIGDGKGGAYVFGSGGNHRLIGPGPGGRRLLGDDP